MPQKPKYNILPHLEKEQDITTKKLIIEKIILLVYEKSSQISGEDYNYMQQATILPNRRRPKQSVNNK